MRLGINRSSALLCAGFQCGNIVGRIHPATHWEPEEISPYAEHEEHTDDEGYVLCEACWEKHLERKAEKEEEEAREAEADARTENDQRDGI